MCDEMLSMRKFNWKMCSFEYARGFALFYQLLYVEPIKNRRKLKWDYFHVKINGNKV